MLASMRPGLLAEWEAYDRIEPFGDEQLTRLFMLLAPNGTKFGDLRRRTAEDAGPTMEETAETVHAALGF